MPDYKKMYLKLFHSSEEAIDMLIMAQRECEELFIRQSDPKLKVVPLPSNGKKSVDKK